MFDRNLFMIVQYFKVGTDKAWEFAILGTNFMISC